MCDVGERGWWVGGGFVGVGGDRGEVLVVNRVVIS